MNQFKNIGTAVVLIMRSRRMTYKSLAKIAGVGEQSIAYAVRANSNDGRLLPALVRTVEVLDVDFDQLMKLANVSREINEILGADAIVNITRNRAYGIKRERGVTKITTTVTGKTKVKSVR